MPEGRSTEDVVALLAVAGEALSTGRWEEARAGFEAALEIESRVRPFSDLPSPCGGCAIR